MVWTSKTETVSALHNPSESTDLAELDQNVRSLMIFSQNIIGNAREKICKVCGKEGRMTIIINNIEVNHTSTRNAMTLHKKIHMGIKL